MHPFLNTATTAARKAGQLIARAFQDVKIWEVRDKGRFDYVTELDKRVEASLLESLREAYPDHGFLAEESGHTPGSSAYEWIIDPLDGTKNFVHGYPNFCISMAVTQEGRLEHGLIYDPLRDEIFTASKGRGAQLNNYRIRVSERSGLHGALLGMAIPVQEALQVDFFKRLQHLSPHISGLRQGGSAALTLAYVAAGRLDGSMELGLQPWDIAAGALIIREAGGVVVDWQGGEDFLKTGAVIAGNLKVVKAIVQACHA